MEQGSYLSLVARRLRREQTDAERVLWAHLRRKQLGGVKFRRQQPIVAYVVGFVAPEQKLVVEVDGSQHNVAEAASSDGDRTMWLEERGYRVLRFWNNEVLGHTEAVVDAIVEALVQPHPLPNPLPSRERRGSRGQVLTLAVMLLGVGMLVVLPLLGQLATMLQKGGNEREQRMKVYANESAISRVIADMTHGADGIATTYTTIQSGVPGTTFNVSTSYTLPAVTVNSYTPAVTIAAPTGATRPTTQANYIDPGVVHPNLATMPPGNGYLMRLYNVKAGTIQVNWAYSPAAKSRIGVWAGTPVSSGQPIAAGQIVSWPAQSPIADNSSGPSATFNRTPAVSVDPSTDHSGGVYTIVFWNNDNADTVTTAPFAATGADTDTWVYALAYRDYIVTASVGAVGTQVYLRQVPGFSEPPDIVHGSGNNYSFTWATNNASFTPSRVYAYQWSEVAIATPVPTPTPAPTPTPGPTPTTGPTPTPTPTPAQSVLAQDDFETGAWSSGSGWLYDWYPYGSASVVNTGSPHGGSYHALMQSSSTYLGRALNLSGRTNIHLRLWAKVSSFESGDNAYLYVTPDFSAWTTLRTWTSADSDDTYRYYDFDLSAITMSGNFWIVFDAEASATNDYFYVDDVQVVGN